MSIYTPWETTQELYGETPVDLSGEGQVWWDEDGDPWVEYIFDSSDEEETDSESESDTDDLFPSEEETGSDTESESESAAVSRFRPPMPEVLGGGRKGFEEFKDEDEVGGDGNDGARDSIASQGVGMRSPFDDDEEEGSGVESAQL